MNRDSETFSRPYEQAIERLREIGLRPTRQRVRLAQLIFNWELCHFTAEILYNEAEKADIGVSLATVYNTLHKFTEVGLLRKVNVDETTHWFDTNTDHHYHFYWVETGRLQDIPCEQIVVEIPTLPAGIQLERIDVIIRLFGKQ